MATWERVATDASVREQTICVPLYLSSTSGIKSNCASFLRTAGYVNTTYVNPVIEYSDIQDWSDGPVINPSQAAYAYIDYDGDILNAQMDSSTLDDTLIEAVGGAAFSVPMGSSSFPQHKIQISAMISNEDSSNANDSSANIHFNLWKADVGTGFMFGNGLANQTLKFKLEEEHLYPGTGPGFCSLPVNGGSIKYENFKIIDVPLDQPAPWAGKTSLYLLSCWVDSTDDVNSTDFSNSINWPKSNGYGNCSIKAWVNITYRRSS